MILKGNFQMNTSNPISKDNLTLKVVLIISLGVVTFYLLTEHRAHLLEYSNYIILLAFILMHVFMHSGHGGGHKGHSGCGGHGHGKHNPKDTANGAEECDGEHGSAGKHKNSRDDVK